jgi:hypothetical protein
MHTGTMVVVAVTLVFAAYVVRALLMYSSRR